MTPVPSPPPTDRILRAILSTIVAMTCFAILNGMSKTLSTSGYPVIELPLGHADDIDAVGRFLFDRGIYVTLAAYPLVPKAQVGFRIQVTAANDDSQIEQLNEVLGELAQRFEMQRPGPAA